MGAAIFVSIDDEPEDPARLSQQLHWMGTSAGGIGEKGDIMDIINLNNDTL